MSDKRPEASQPSLLDFGVRRVNRKSCAVEFAKSRVERLLDRCSR